MLIKIANAPYLEGSSNNSYTIYYKVDSIEICRAKPIELTDNKQIHQNLIIKGLFAHPEPDIFIDILNMDRINDFIEIDNGLTGRPANENLSENKVYRYNFILFSKEGKRYYATFDTIAYICNDKGETIERCFAGGVLQKNADVIG